jgi:hypothetical protein
MNERVQRAATKQEQEADLQMAVRERESSERRKREEKIVKRNGDVM